MVLTDSAIYEQARQAGFPADVATQMVAIALRESRGDPNAHNTTPPDDSYGLWQINMYDQPAGTRAARLQLFGISDPAQLYDPATNARAAFILYGGNPANLDIAWAINRSGPPYFYAEKYQAFLPRAEAAAAGSPLGSPVILASGGGGDTSTGADTSPPFPTGRGLQAAPSSRPASLVTSAPGGRPRTLLPRWLSQWWRGRFSSMPLQDDAGLREAMEALVASFGKDAVIDETLRLLKPGHPPVDPRA